MAKTAKNAMKVKTGLETYQCSWTFATPVDEWDRSTLLANIRTGLRYVISQKIKNQVAADEQNMVRNSAILKFMTATMQGDAEKMAQLNEFCRIQNIRTNIQTEYIFHESDFAVEVEDPEEE